jgi:thymidylate synthase (FAD)
MRGEDRTVKLINVSVGPAPDRQAIVRFLADVMGICHCKDGITPSALYKALRAGHTSLMEHVSFTIKARHWSRNMLLELERHRIGISLTVESTRYVDYSDFTYEVPAAVAAQDMSDTYASALETCRQAYAALLAAGVPKDAAREVLPGSTQADFVITMNLRALQHLFTLRCAPNAHEEIQSFAWKLFEAIEPFLTAELAWIVNPWTQN